MATAGRKVAQSRRYMLTKLFFAAEEFAHSLISHGQGTKAATQQSGPVPSVLTQAIEKFKEAYSKQMTMTMYLAGAAMYPNLNKQVAKDPEAIAKLVVRLLPRPSTRSVWVGDVVAFNSPLGKPSETQVMVRRVAAVEGMEMTAQGGDSGEDDFLIPAGHCWVLADNEDMKPPQVIDSRTFGFMPMTNILGRVIYSGSSPSDHAPVVNSPMAQIADDAVLEQEVVMAGVFAGEEEGKEQDKQ